MNNARTSSLVSATTTVVYANKGVKKLLGVLKCHSLLRVEKLISFFSLSRCERFFWIYKNSFLIKVRNKEVFLMGIFTFTFRWHPIHLQMKKSSRYHKAHKIHQNYSISNFLFLSAHFKVCSFRIQIFLKLFFSLSIHRKV